MKKSWIFAIVILILFLTGLFYIGVRDPPNKELLPNCTILKHDGESLNNHVNIVFVPSGFNGDMEKFEGTVNLLWDGLQDYTPFDKSIKELNAFYVTAEAEPNSFCAYDLPDTPRVALCNPFVSKQLSSTCYGGQHQTVVVNNVEEDSARFGAGFPNFVFISIGDSVVAGESGGGGRILAHELGHAAFWLGDEYTYTPEYEAFLVDIGFFRNLDGPDCSKWADMIGFNGVGCLPDYGYEGGYYIGEPSLMVDQKGYEEVNERIACCDYKLLTGTYPPSLCNKFRDVGLGLDVYCSQEGARLLTQVSNPVQYLLTRTASGWEVEEPGKLPPGSYPSSFVSGEGIGKGDFGAIDVELDLIDGSSKTLQFLDKSHVDYIDADGVMRVIEVARDFITVIVDEDDSLKKPGRHTKISVEGVEVL